MRHSRFKVGDVVIYRGNPSRPLTVITVDPTDGMVFVLEGSEPCYWPRYLHHTGMRRVGRISRAIVVRP